MEDERICKLWSVIKIRHGAWNVKTYSKQEKLHSDWKPLAEGWYKVNFDGATKFNLGLSGVGFVIRNEKSEIVKYMGT